MTALQTQSALPHTHSALRCIAWSEEQHLCNCARHADFPWCATLASEGLLTVDGLPDLSFACRVWQRLIGSLHVHRMRQCCGPHQRARGCHRPPASSRWCRTRMGGAPARTRRPSSATPESGAAFAQAGAAASAQAAAAAGAGNVAPTIASLPRQHVRQHGWRGAVPAHAPAPASNAGSVAAAPASEAAAEWQAEGSAKLLGAPAAAELPGHPAAAPAAGAASTRRAPAARWAGEGAPAAPAPAPETGAPQGVAAVSQATGGVSGGADEQTAVSDQVAGPYADIPYGNPHGVPRAEEDAKPSGTVASVQRAAAAPAVAAAPRPAVSVADPLVAATDTSGNAAGDFGSKRMVVAMTSEGGAGPDTAGPAAAPLAAAAGASGGPEAGTGIMESGADPPSGPVERTAGALAAPAPAPLRSNPSALVPGSSKGLTSLAVPTQAPLLPLPATPEVGEYGSVEADAPLLSGRR